MQVRESACRDVLTDRDVETVADHDVSAPFDEVVAEYESVVGDRDRFLWRWLDLLVPEVTLSCVDAGRREDARLAKLLATTFVVLLDDLAEKHRDRATFEAAARIPFEGDPVGHDDPTARPDAPDVDEAYLRFADRVWRRFEAELADAPRVEEFEDVLSFDVGRNVDAIDYSALANAQPHLANVREATRLGSHNMMLLTYADVDLAYSRSFDRADLAALRAAVSDAQEMLRITNWLATWEREVEEGDFSSGVVIHALENGIVSPADLREVRERGTERDREWLIRRIRERDVECRFVERYLLVRYESTSFDADLSSVDLDAYLDGVQDVVGYYLGTYPRL